MQRGPCLAWLRIAQFVGCGWVVGVGATSWTSLVDLFACWGPRGFSNVRLRAGPQLKTGRGARVRKPCDKPRVERYVPYVRSNFFVEEQFRDLNDCRGRAEAWCREVAGQQVHSTTRQRPAEVLAAEEHPRLRPAADGALRHAGEFETQNSPGSPCSGVP